MSGIWRKQVATCFWCEQQVERSAPQFKWFDNWQSANCEFHPAAWDDKKLLATGILAPHQSEEEVHDIIKTAFFEGKSVRKVTDNVVSISKRAKMTSRKAAEKVMPKAGSIRQQVYSAIIRLGGLTDFELEDLLRIKHQTVSASRNSLMKDGFIFDSGERRKNKSGNECIVWRVSSMEQAALFR